jgi:hypothetical protein
MYYWSWPSLRLQELQLRNGRPVHSRYWIEYSSMILLCSAVCRMPECRGSRRNSFYLENFATLSCKWVLYSCHYARNYECNIEPGVILAAEKPAISTARLGVGVQFRSSPNHHARRELHMSACSLHCIIAWRARFCMRWRVADVLVFVIRAPCL